MAPPKIKRPIAVSVANCAKMKQERVWNDPETQTNHQLSQRQKVTYISSTTVGKIT